MATIKGRYYRVEQNYREREDFSNDILLFLYGIKNTQDIDSPYRLEALERVKAGTLNTGEELKRLIMELVEQRKADGILCALERDIICHAIQTDLVEWQAIVRAFNKNYVNSAFTAELIKRDL